MKTNGIIVSLFLVAALFTIVGCSNSSSNDSSESQIDTTVAETVEESSSKAASTSIDDSTTSTSTTVATTTVIETSPVSDEEIKSASLSAMADLLKPPTNGALQPIFNGYEIADINNDKIPELLVSYKSMDGGNLIHLFVYENGKYTKIEKFKNGTNDEYPYISEDCSYDPEKGIISYNSNGGGSARYILQLKNDNRLILIEQLLFYSNEYSHNGDVISESEYNALNAEFDSSYNWKKLEIKPLPAEVQSSAAPKETYKYIGVVTLNSGTLNLRDFPSTDSNVITQLNNGTRCSVYTLDGYPDWYKVYINELSGYVSAKYIQEFKEKESKGTNDTSSYSSQEIKITCLSSIPSTYSEYNSKGEIGSSFSIDKVWFNYTKEDNSNVVGYYSLQIHISGQKIYDIEGDSSYDYTNIGIKLYNADRTVDFFDDIIVPKMRVNDYCTDAYHYFTEKIPAGEYFIEFTNSDQWGDYHK